MNDNAYRARAAELSAESGKHEMENAYRVECDVSKTYIEQNDHFRHLINQRRIARATMNDGTRR
jgi:hypothetical protein